jgi:hypothetical protein
LVERYSNMMALVFALLSLALVLAWFGRRPIAVGFMILTLCVAVGEFLWEVYSPEYGFRMPWIQTRIIENPPVPDNTFAVLALTRGELS